MVAGFLLLTASLFVNNSVYGVLLQTFDDPTPTGPDEFGESVALDGNRVLVGSPSIFPLSSSFGRAHLFDATTGLLLETFNDPTPTGSDMFGISLALDGNRALVGAHNDNTEGRNVGQVHLFGPPFGGMPIGGELIPIDTTSLLLAGTQMTASWIIPVIVAGAGIGIVIARKL